MYPVHIHATGSPCLASSAVALHPAPCMSSHFLDCIERNCCHACMDSWSSALTPSTRQRARRRFVQVSMVAGSGICVATRHRQQDNKVLACKGMCVVAAADTLILSPSLQRSPPPWLHPGCPTPFTVLHVRRGVVRWVLIRSLECQAMRCADVVRHQVVGPLLILRPRSGRNYLLSSCLMSVHQVAGRCRSYECMPYPSDWTQTR